MIKEEIKILGSKVLVLGITFKENCPDIRNTKVIDLIDSLKDYGCDVDIYDPWADNKEVKEEYGVYLIDNPNDHYDVSVLAVAHNEFFGMDLDCKLDYRIK
jgi:UDP-N-acetyl-D-galactosamine dehydrogenase